MEDIYSEKDILKILQKRKNKKLFKTFSGVHHIDVGYKYTGGEKTNQLAIRFHVYRKKSSSFLNQSAIPQVIDEIPTDIIECHYHKHDLTGYTATTLIGGIQIANCNILSYGTMGAIVYDSSQKAFGLTNHHVVCNDTTNDGESIMQPYDLSVNQSDIIGTLSNSDVTLDCAIFELNGSRIIDPNSIYSLLGKIKQTTEPSTGKPVKKYGCKTGLTFGEIDGVGDTFFSIKSSVNPPILISDCGDSGSIWLLDSPLNDTAVGLHYGGGNSTTTNSPILSYAMKISQVLIKMKVNF